MPPTRPRSQASNLTAAARRTTPSAVDAMVLNIRGLINDGGLGVGE